MVTLIWHIMKMLICRSNGAWLLERGGKWSFAWNEICFRRKSKRRKRNFCMKYVSGESQRGGFRGISSRQADSQQEERISEQQLTLCIGNKMIKSFHFLYDSQYSICIRLLSMSVLNFSFHDNITETKFQIYSMLLFQHLYNIWVHLLKI